jgi:hypothetical protein
MSYNKYAQNNPLNINKVYFMKQVKIVGNEEFEVLSNTYRCSKCKHRQEIVVSDIKCINIACKHPKGPGNPSHCIYFSST